MNYNEEASDVLDELVLTNDDEDTFKAEVRILAAFGRRCAEAMREECAKVAEAHAETQGVNVVLHVAQAIRRVEIK